jgi:hypothetical protein
MVMVLPDTLQAFGDTWPNRAACDGSLVSEVSIGSDLCVIDGLLSIFNRDGLLFPVAVKDR